MTKQDQIIAQAIDRAYGDPRGPESLRRMGQAKLRAIEIKTQVRIADAMERIAKALAGDGDTCGSLLELIADRIPHG